TLLGFGSCVRADQDVYRQAKQAIAELAAKAQLPSLSVAIGKGEDVTLATAVGYANVQQGLEATTRTRYSVASVAKPMTTVALALLVDTGRVQLDAPVGRYLDHPAYVDSFTVRELAAHLAGIPHDTAERERAEFLAPKDHQSPFDAFYVFEQHGLLFEPGTDFYYSSSGYILLSALIERVSKKGFVNYLQMAVWSELGMSETALDTLKHEKGEEATYYATFDSNQGYTAAERQRDRSFLFGGGGFLSTPSDLVKLARATYDTNFLSAEARHAMYTATPLRNGEPNSENYSLGWRVGSIQSESTRQWLTLEHAGLMEGAATAYLLVVPECQQSLAFATNFVPRAFWELFVEAKNLLRLTLDESLCVKASMAD
ncbi:MAG: serine hydrolase domain-containing protein, partial [Pseudomonadota bacterium]